MAKLLKLIVVIALLAGIYFMFFQAEWHVMDSQDLGITAMAPAPGTRSSQSDQDRLIGLHKTEEVGYVANREAFSIARSTGRKITHGNLSMSDYEKSLIDGLYKEYKFQHQKTETIRHENVAGIEVMFLLPDGKTESHFRIFSSKDVVYSISYISPGGLKYDYRRYRFFSSLKFTD